ncbi:hypothetical protein [Nonomuraea rubra]|uniref:Lipoprotein n=1 Tax=Nonomuraea rubra TaxID=46180 RepID=A0A7X0NRI6_9ACTN|nr:hypothetical protein [Nonomuraea rubra]MBB6548240.1 hypothetical protein [Nonomuraea rubra]
MLRLTLLLLATLTACSSGERPCTMMASLEGVHVDVDQAVAARAEHLAIEVCWDGACRRSSGELMPATRQGEQTCSGDTCSVTAVRTGAKFGFGTVSGLPKRPVEVRLTLSGAGGSEPVPARTIRVTPKATFPNGPDCGEGAPQVKLTVAADGTVREG